MDSKIQATDYNSERLMIFIDKIHEVLVKLLICRMAKADGTLHVI